MDKKLNYRIINLVAIIALIYLLVHTIGVCWGIIGSALQLLAPFIVGFAFA